MRPSSKIKRNDNPEIAPEYRLPLEVTIHDFGHSGEGVGRYAGLTVFVPGAAPGDTVLVQVTKQQPRYLHAHLLRIVTPSPERNHPECTWFPTCGGCQLQHVSYDAQLAWKHERVRQVLTRLGGLQDVNVLPIIPSVTPWHYRNKAQFPVGMVDGQVNLGFYEQGSHSLVPIDQCLVQHPRIGALIPKLRQLVEVYNIPPYIEPTGQGILRHVLCRVSFTTEELLLTLVVTQRDFPGLAPLVQQLTEAFSPLAGITLNVNTHKGNRILGDHNYLLYGNEYLTETLNVYEHTVTFRISASAFFQVNPVQAQRLFATAVDYAQVSSDTTALDAYCGTGSLTLFLAKAGAKKVWGIEEVRQAVVDAQANADLNGISNVSFVQGKVETIAPGLMAQEGAPEVLVVDPPRAGLDRGFIETALTWNVQRWVYVSCNPATLARDMQIICASGYRVLKVQPVDMFPHTAHVECVVLMCASS
jgi:23S rRNA (uracil1939-C5)-methyltransferase